MSQEGWRTQGHSDYMLMTPKLVSVCQTALPGVNGEPIYEVHLKLRTSKIKLLSSPLAQ